MQDVKWYLSRLQSMDGAEIRWRIHSIVRDQLDAARTKLGLLPRLNESIIGTASSFEPGFRCTPVTTDDWDNLSNDDIESWRARLLAKARLLLRNELSYFDISNEFHGDPMQWHRDISSGKVAPANLCIRTDYRDFQRNGDCKLVWEPNRHHQLVVLARAYRVTGDEAFATKVYELLDSWLESNPFGYGMNWKSPLEVGVRLINWVYAIDLLGSDARPEVHTWSKLLNAVYRSVWDTQRKFSQGSSANNHLVGEAAGVYIACSYFDRMPSASKWKAKAKAVLEREILRQSYPDGCTAEHAFGYQFFVVQFFLYCAMAGDATSDRFSERFLERLHEMYRFLADVSADTGMPPNLGDADSGYVLDLGELPNQPAQLSAAAATYFSDHDLAPGTASETAFWLFGNIRSAGEPNHEPLASSAYPESGYFILRSGEIAGTYEGRTSVFIDCAELGYGPIAAHGHADCLSICVNVGNTPLFVDSGTYDYFSHPEWRQYFRSTKAHNTAEIDGVSQSESLGPFMFGRRANPTLVEWSDIPDSVVFEGQHDGYCRLDDPVVHRRRVTLLKENAQISIIDHFDAIAEHEIALHFQVDPAWSIGDVVENSVQLTSGKLKIELQADSGKLGVVNASSTEKLGWISHGYHQKSPSACIRVSTSADGPTEIHTTIRPIA